MASGHDPGRPVLTLFRRRGTDPEEEEERSVENQSGQDAVLLVSIAHPEEASS